MYTIRHKKGELRNASDLKEYKNIMRHPLLAKKHNALTFHSLVYFHECHSLYFSLTKDYKNDVYHIENLIKLMESNEHHIAENPSAYMIVLTNFIGTQIWLKNYSKASLYLEKLRSLVPRSERLKNKLFQNRAVLEFTIYIETGQFNKGLPLIKEIRDELDKSDGGLLKNNIIIEMLLAFNAFCIYFGLGDYKDAKLWLNKILNDGSLDRRVDLLCFARIMNLILHFELGDQEALEHITRSTYRFLYKRERLYKMETIILHFIRNKMPKMNSPKEFIEAFKELKKEFIKLSEDTFEKNVFEYFDFISWLESKIEKRSFSEIVKEKAGKGQ